MLRYRRPIAPCFVLLLAAPLTNVTAAEPTNADPLVTRFLAHVRTDAPLETRAEIETLWHGWGTARPQAFLPAALRRLEPRFDDALRAFDAGQPDAAAQSFAALLDHTDPYVAANASYFHARALVDAGLLEEAAAALANLEDRSETLTAHSPFAAQLWFTRAHCEFHNLEFERAAATLARLESTFTSAPASVRIGIRQMQLELQRRTAGTLTDVADAMNYSATRLAAAEAGPRLLQRQEQIVAMLDDLITEAQQKEQAQGGSGQPSAAQQQSQPRSGARESVLPEAGPGEIGALHEAPRANPAEVWGKLPPAERERILQSLRERFPSRYRHLVEQYYRSLAEEPQP